MSHPPSQADRVRTCLGAGPKYVFEIAQETGLTSSSASRAAQHLVTHRHAKQVGKRLGYWLYALVDFKPPRASIFRGDAARKAEEAFVAGRIAGRQAADLAEDLGLTATTADVFEKAYRYQTGSPISRDGTVPRFAYHDDHLASVMKRGGYPWLSERRMARGQIAPVLPLNWPTAFGAAA